MAIRRGPASRGGSPRGRRPGVEALEGRRLPATYLVNTTGDGADPSAPTLSLREAIELADGTLDAAALSPEAQLQVTPGVGGPAVIDFAIPVVGAARIALASPLPAITAPTVLDGYTQPGSSPNTNGPGQGDNARPMVVLDATGIGVGLTLKGGDSRVLGLVITGFHDAALVLDDAGGDVIRGNFLGTDGSGSGGTAGGDGVRIMNGSRDTIGGTSAADRNVIVSQAGYAIGFRGDLGGATGDNLVQGNLIGTDASGQHVPTRNPSFIGVAILGSSGNTIGGATPGAGNVISGANGNGIVIGPTPAPGAPPSVGNVIQGNLIGSDVTLTYALGNQGNGIVDFGQGTTIGGTIRGAGNLIESNGITPYGSNPNDVGVALDGTGALVQGNNIGANAGDGVLVTGSGNTIGGSGIAPDPAAVNQISDNMGSGVAVAQNPFSTTVPVGNSIRGNSIAFNHKLGIDLAGGSEDAFGVTANAPGGPHAGPNDLQNAPVITGFYSYLGRESVEVHATLKSTPNATFFIDFYSDYAPDPSGHGQGAQYLGTTMVTTDGAGDTSLIGTFRYLGSIPPQYIAATATDAAGNTSEFSKTVATGGYPRQTTEAVASAGTPTLAGEPVTLTATVSAPGAGLPITGTVTFLDGTTPLGNANLSIVAVGPNSSDSRATLTTATLRPGQYSITAVYSGDPDYLAGTSPAILQEVDPQPSTTTLTFAPPSSVAGTHVLLTATVAGPLTTAPTGPVEFFDGAKELGAAMLRPGSGGSGVATFDAGPLGVGTHDLRAVFGGGASLRPSASPTVAVPVLKAAGVVTISSSVLSAPAGRPVTFTALVAGVPGLATPGGTVTFLDGGRVLGRAPVIARGPGGGGSASFTTEALGPGRHSITAAFGGSAALEPGRSRALAETIVRAASRTTLAVAPNPPQQGRPVTLTATVASGVPGGPAGSVRFLDGSAVLGVVPLGPGGRATLVKTLAPGRHALTASYGGSADVSGSRSAAVTVAVATPPATDGPRVIGLRRAGYHWMPTTIVLTFNAPLDPARARDVSNYLLTGPAPSGRVIPIASADYDALAGTVTLHPARRLDVHPRFRYTLVIRGSSPGGVAGRAGELLDGAGTGRPGSDYVATFSGFGPPPADPSPTRSPAPPQPANAAQGPILRPFRI